jgi:hypothetical protein
MREIMAISEIPVLAVCAVALFTIVFATILACVTRIGMFGPSASVVVALSVSLLGLIGLYRMFIETERGHPAPIDSTEHLLDVLLMPYTLTAIAILLSLFLIFMHRVLYGRERTGRKNGPGKVQLLGVLKRQGEPPVTNRMSDQNSGSRLRSGTPESQEVLTTQCNDKRRQRPRPCGGSADARIDNR